MIPRPDEGKRSAPGGQGAKSWAEQARTWDGSGESDVAKETKRRIWKVERMEAEVILHALLRLPLYGPWGPDTQDRHIPQDSTCARAREFPVGRTSRWSGLPRARGLLW